MAFITYLHLELAGGMLEILHRDMKRVSLNTRFTEPFHPVDKLYGALSARPHRWDENFLNDETMKQC